MRHDGSVDDLREEMLRAYDRDLRGDAELVGATRVTPTGPVLLGEFDDGGGGFVAYRDLGGLEAGTPMMKATLVPCPGADVISQRPPMAASRAVMLARP